MHDLRPRHLLNLLPALLMAGVVLSTLFGEYGLIRRHMLMRHFAEVHATAEELQQENALLRREIRRIQQSRVALERKAAEELLMAPPGATIYRFAPEEVPAEGGEAG